MSIQTITDVRFAGGVAVVETRAAGEFVLTEISDADAMVTLLERFAVETPADLRGRRAKIAADGTILPAARATAGAR